MKSDFDADSSTLKAADTARLLPRWVDSTEANSDGAPRIVAIRDSRRVLAATSKAPRCLAKSPSAILPFRPASLGGLPWTGLLMGIAPPIGRLAK